jgi:lipoate---protein ligase
VVLTPGCLVFTFAFYAKEIFNNDVYFKFINELWCEALANIGFERIHTNGISDLAIGNKKIAGTSMFRKKHLLVYQGSLLVDPNLDLIFSLLKHPSKEPDYRRGRSHEEFLTSLKKEFGLNANENLNTQEIAKRCDFEVKKILNSSRFLWENSLMEKDLVGSAIV